ncbi:molybdopterin-dependent oxidoreductase [Pseudofrankia asymbiotica]|uniref:molybdopterin-dependent oxidoreductase n=1 Tax=Pseudofrankia asymbiotica TaxID=1834516 RepID=UPI000977A146|nr:molybdopterin-dependent oxidoreductase [Pseudofrankia asymbiotica]
MSPDRAPATADVAALVAASGADAAASRAVTPSHCPYCALQCGIELRPRPGLVDLTPRDDFPTNRGGLCSKGWTAAGLLDHPDRLTTPLLRDRRAAGTPGDLRPATWDEALERIVTGWRRCQHRYGLDSVGVFGGGGLTNEKVYALGKFVRIALRSRSIDYNGRFCMSSAAAAGNRAFGIDRGLPFPVSDIAEADVILLVGGNPADTMPPIMQWFDAGRAKGARHIVVDPRATPTARGAHLHLQPTPGTDLALAAGLLHIAIRDGLVDTGYIASRTTGFDAVRRAVTAYWPGRVERITGVPEGQLREAVRLLADAERAIVLTARGAEQHASGTDTAQAFINLALALGLPGRSFSGYGTITGQGNGQGGREHGQKADQLPGYRKLADPADRAHIAAIWGVSPDELPPPGVSAFEMLDALGTEGGVRAMWVLGSNPIVSGPDANRIADRLAALDLLVVSDFFLSETAALADVVLPVAQWAEEEGTMTNLEGRVLRRRRALAPPPGVRTDLDVIAELATRLGCSAEAFPAEPRVVFEELRRASAGGLADYSGISYERIEAEKGVFWPCPAPVTGESAAGEAVHPGTPRLFAERFATPDGRARFVAVRHRGAAETPDRDFPYYLTTGRTMRQYQSGTQTRRVRALVADDPDPVVELHPVLAARHAITAGDLVELKSRRGLAIFRARVTDTIRQDTLFAPFHWGGYSTVNLLTNPALDPISRMPEFKACAVTLRPIGRLPDGGAALPTEATVPVATGWSRPRDPSLSAIPAQDGAGAPPPALTGLPGPGSPVLPGLAGPTGTVPATTSTAPGASSARAGSDRAEGTTPASHRKDRRMHSTPRFLQGVFSFEGQGLKKPTFLDPSLAYTVPPGTTTQPVYFRGGNASDELVYVLLVRDGAPMRYFPIGARADVHVPLRVVEDLLGDTRIELHLAAPEGVEGTVIIDFGLIEF